MNGRRLIAEVLTLACLEAGIRGRQQPLHCWPRTSRHQRQQYGWDAAD